MKRSVWLFASVLALGMVSGAASVVACGGGAKADAATEVSVTRVVDGSGATLGTFLGVATGWWNGLPGADVFSFLSPDGRIWHVFGNGMIRQAEIAAYYTSAGCTGPVYLAYGAVQGVARAAGEYWTVAATSGTVTPASWVPAGAMIDGCVEYVGSAITVRVATVIAPPSVTPPVRIE